MNQCRQCDIYEAELACLKKLQCDFLKIKHLIFRQDEQLRLSESNKTRNVELENENKALKKEMQEMKSQRLKMEVLTGQQTKSIQNLNKEIITLQSKIKYLEEELANAENKIENLSSISNASTSSTNRAKKGVNKNKKVTLLSEEGNRAAEEDLLLSELIEKQLLQTVEDEGNGNALDDDDNNDDAALNSSLVKLSCSSGEISWPLPLPIDTSVEGTLMAATPTVIPTEGVKKSEQENTSEAPQSSRGLTNDSTPQMLEELTDINILDELFHTNQNEVSLHRTQATKNLPEEKLPPDENSSGANCKEPTKQNSEMQVKSNFKNTVLGDNSAKNATDVPNRNLNFIELSDVSPPITASTASTSKETMSCAPKRKSNLQKSLKKNLDVSRVSAKPVVPQRVASKVMRSELNATESSMCSSHDPNDVSDKLQNYGSDSSSEDELHEKTSRVWGDTSRLVLDETCLAEDASMGNVIISSNTSPLITLARPSTIVSDPREKLNCQSSSLILDTFSGNELSKVGEQCQMPKVIFNSVTILNSSEFCTASIVDAAANRQSLLQSHCIPALSIIEEPATAIFNSLLESEFERICQSSQYVSIEKQTEVDKSAEPLLELEDSMLDICDAEKSCSQNDTIVTTNADKVSLSKSEELDVSRHMPGNDIHKMVEEPSFPSLQCNLETELDFESSADTEKQKTDAVLSLNEQNENKLTDGETSSASCDQIQDAHPTEVLCQNEKQETNGHLKIPNAICESIHSGPESGIAKELNTTCVIEEEEEIVSESEFNISLHQSDIELSPTKLASDFFSDSLLIATKEALSNTSLQSVNQNETEDVDFSTQATELSNLVFTDEDCFEGSCSRESTAVDVTPKQDEVHLLDNFPSNVAENSDGSSTLNEFIMSELMNSDNFDHFQQSSTQSKFLSLPFKGAKWKRLKSVEQADSIFNEILKFGTEKTFFDESFEFFDIHDSSLDLLEDSFEMRDFELVANRDQIDVHREVDVLPTTLECNVSAVSFYSDLTSVDVLLGSSGSIKASVLECDSENSVSNSKTISECSKKNLSKRNFDIDTLVSSNKSGTPSSNTAISLKLSEKTVSEDSAQELEETSYSTSESKESSSFIGNIMQQDQQDVDISSSIQITTKSSTPKRRRPLNKHGDSENKCGFLGYVFRSNDGEKETNYSNGELEQFSEKFQIQIKVPKLDTRNLTLDENSEKSTKIRNNKFVKEPMVTKSKKLIRVSAGSCSGNSKSPEQKAPSLRSNSKKEIIADGFAVKISSDFEPIDPSKEFVCKKSPSINRTCKRKKKMHEIESVEAKIVRSSLAPVTCTIDLVNESIVSSENGAIPKWKQSEVVAKSKHKRSELINEAKGAYNAEEEIDTMHRCVARPLDQKLNVGDDEKVSTVESTISPTTANCKEAEFSEASIQESAIQMADTMCAVSSSTSENDLQISHDSEKKASKDPCPEVSEDRKLNKDSFDAVSDSETENEDFGLMIDVGEEEQITESSLQNFDSVNMPNVAILCSSETEVPDRQPTLEFTASSKQPNNGVKEFEQSTNKRLETESNVSQRVSRNSIKAQVSAAKNKVIAANAERFSTMGNEVDKQQNSDNFALSSPPLDKDKKLVNWTKGKVVVPPVPTVERLHLEDNNEKKGIIASEAATMSVASLKCMNSFSIESNATSSSSNTERVPNCSEGSSSMNFEYDKKSLMRELSKLWTDLNVETFESVYRRIRDMYSENKCLTVSFFVTSFFQFLTCLRQKKSLSQKLTLLTDITIKLMYLDKHKSKVLWQCMVRKCSSGSVLNVDFNNRRRNILKWTFNVAQQIHMRISTGEEKLPLACSIDELMSPIGVLLYDTIFLQLKDWIYIVNDAYGVLSHFNQRKSHQEAMRTDQNAFDLMMSSMECVVCKRIREQTNADILGDIFNLNFHTTIEPFEMAKAISSQFLFNQSPQMKDESSSFTIVKAVVLLLHNCTTIELDGFLKNFVGPYLGFMSSKCRSLLDTVQSRSCSKSEAINFASTAVTIIGHVALFKLEDTQLCHFFNSLNLLTIVKECLEFSHLKSSFTHEEIEFVDTFQRCCAEALLKMHPVDASLVSRLLLEERNAKILQKNRIKIPHKLTLHPTNK